MRTFTILGMLVAVGCMLLPAQGPPPPVRPLPGGSYLGIGIQEINADRAKALKLPPGAVVEITRVGNGSPADKAGLKTGDVVLQYNGVRVEGASAIGVSYPGFAAEVERLAVRPW